MRHSLPEECRCRSPFNGILREYLSKCLATVTNRLQLTCHSQWNVAFGTPPPSTASQSSPPLRPPPAGNNYELRTPVEPSHPNYQLPNVSPQSSSLQGAQSQLPTSSSYAAPGASYVTPTMWQEVVASSFPDGLKRRWDHGNTGMVDQSMYKRAR